MILGADTIKAIDKEAFEFLSNPATLGVVDSIVLLLGFKLSRLSKNLIKANKDMALYKYRLGEVEKKLKRQ